jgi:hypothetical protein
MNCKFLGSAENESQQIGPKKTQAETAVVNKEKIEADKTKNATVACCSSCNVEMSQTKTKFKISGWPESQRKLADDDSLKFGDEFLPAIVFLCPKCGRIEFRVEE